MSNLMKKLNKTVNAFFVLVDQNKEERKTVGAKIGDLVREAYRTKDSEAIEAIEKNMKEKIAAWLAAKQYVTKGKTVGSAEAEAGKEFDGATTTVYDKILAARKEEKAKNENLGKALSAQQMQDNAALLAVHGTQDAVDAFIMATTDDRQTYLTALNQGYAVLAERAEADKKAAFEAELANQVTSCKAFLDLLKADYPQYFSEILNHMQTLVPAKKQKVA